MTRKPGFTLIELVIVVAIIGLLAAIAIPAYSRFRTHAMEAGVKGNCHTLQLAAEDFAVENQGVYANDTDTDQTVLGSTVLDLMPGALMLKNPFTNVRSEPQSSGAAATPGQVGYVPIVGGSGTTDGYTITGFGRTATIISLTNGH